VTAHLGLDIGGTKTEAVVTDAGGLVLGQHRVDSGHGPDAVVAAALEAADAACALAGLDVRAASSAGVGIPGAISDGVVRHAVNLSVERLDLADRLAEAWGKRPVIENDVNAAAVGAWILSGDGERSIAYLNLGTGLAAGIIIGGKLWRGARGAAGEIGHVSVNPAGPTGPDGLPGGLEAYAGGVGVALAAGAGPTAAEILGDPDANETRAALCFGVASAVRVLVLTVDVEEVIIGGGITRLGSALTHGVKEQLDEWSSASTFLSSVDLAGRFRVLETDEPVAAIGAAMVGAGRG
jgi:glucokinase